MSDLRAKILTIATQLFIQRGYHGLAVREIAEAVGVSKAALYYHFKDKEELLLAILDVYLDDAEALLDQVRQADGPSRQQVRSLVHCILAQPAEQRAMIRLASQEMAHLSEPARKTFGESYHVRFIGKIQAILNDGIQQGELKSCDSLLATWALLGMMYPYFYPAHAADISVSGPTADQLADIFLDGLAV